MKWILLALLFIGCGTDHYVKIPSHGGQCFQRFQLVGCALERRGYVCTFQDRVSGRYIDVDYRRMHELLRVRVCR